MTRSFTQPVTASESANTAIDLKSPGWRVVAVQECRDLWVSARGLLLVFVYSVLLSAITYLAATNQILNFLEQREAVNLTLQVSVAIGVLVVLVVSADAISGERERGTLESLLLTPVSRRGIAAGKVAAAMSLWFAAWLVSVPYVWILGRGVRIVGEALLLSLLVGTLLGLGLSAVGILISAASTSNKVSLSASLFLLLALFAPSQLPTATTHAGFSEVLLRLNPIASVLHYMSAVLARGHGWTADWSYLVSALALVVLAGGALIVTAPRTIRLAGGVSGG
ncbi:MAG: type transport system permease protein [Pseudonocardiales bacterium]|jgi:ABC-2 type transport system permease protein|nr:type transport system permease protein [Pseudonocardiales bacterium]MDQ1751422.1 type transport system permease protein [Pseudonocardiales bacterium]